MHAYESRPSPLPNGPAVNALPPRGGGVAARAFLVPRAVVEARRQGDDRTPAVEEITALALGTISILLALVIEVREAIRRRARCWVSARAGLGGFAWPGREPRPWLRSHGA